jgi:hypothetical protein
MLVSRHLTLIAAAFAFLAGGCGTGADAPEADAPEAADELASSPDGSDDLADVTNYRLTMDGVNRYFDATMNVARVVQNMTPAERAAFEGPQEEEEMPTLDEMAARMEQNPAVASAVRDAGLSTREYAVIAMSMLQAGMAQAFAAMQPGADQDSLARAMGVSAENMAFMRDNAEELGRRQEEMASVMQELEPQE